MIVYMDILLHKWGRVKKSGYGMAVRLGYPKSAPFTRLTPSLSRTDATISDMWDVDQCVSHLDRAQYDLVHLHYVQQLRMADVAARLGCHRDTCYSRLHAIHVDVMNMLNDMSAGVPLRKKVLRAA